jgi:hypothetical protein
MAMPLYYFHLSFGERMAPDEEGVELPNRAAAHAEALAVIQDLADAENGRRWASWFLDVTDEQGSFLRLPIGYPALEVSPKDGRARRAASSFKLGDPTVSPDPLRAGPLRGRAAALVRERLAISQQTAALLEQNRQLRQELSSERSLSQQTRRRTRQLVASIPVVGAGEDADTDGQRRARDDRPHLVLLKGGAAG